jgi:hypothetical protein
VQKQWLHRMQVLSMALTPTLAALGAKFAGMQSEADAEDVQPSDTGETEG